VRLRAHEGDAEVLHETPTGAHHHELVDHFVVVALAFRHSKSRVYSSTGATCSIFYQMGNNLVPMSPVKGGVAETWLNTQQAFHNLGSISPGSRCSINNWITNSYQSDSTMGSFAFAQNFDSFMHKSTDMIPWHSLRFSTARIPLRCPSLTAWIRSRALTASLK
jgi:hypothetical protein